MARADDAEYTRVDRPKTWLALLVVNTFAPVTAGVLPAVVAMLVDQQRIAPPDAGHVSSLYSLGGMLAGLSGLLWIRRLDRRVALATGSVVGFCADLSAVWLHGYGAIAAGRLFAGLAGSSTIIVANATIALSRHSERLFGLVLTSQSLLAAGLFFALPRLSLGVTELFLLLAVFWAVVLPFSFFVPRGAGLATPGAAAGERCTERSFLRFSVVLLMLAFLCFYIATGALWTFLCLIGEWHGISAAAVGSALSLSMLAAIAGGSLVTLLGKRYGCSRPLIIALVANVIFTAILLPPIGIGTYALAVCATNLLFTFALALFLTLFGDEDAYGRLLSAANIIIFGGLALGPWLLGSSTGGGSYRTLLIVTVVLFAASPALLWLRRLLLGKSGGNVGLRKCSVHELTPPRVGSGGAGR